MKIFGSLKQPRVTNAESAAWAFLQLHLAATMKENVTRLLGTVTVGFALNGQIVLLGVSVIQ